MDRRIGELLTILSREWPRPLKLCALADAVHLSPSHIEHLFKQEMRCSIRDFIAAKRLSEAAHQIAETDERISSISYAVGFSDLPNFNHSFKKRYGVSPREFRRASRTAARTK